MLAKIIAAGWYAVYVCVCKAIRLSDAVEAARTNGTDPEGLMEAFGFDDGDACGRCASRITDLSVLVRLELDKSRLNLAAA